MGKLKAALIVGGIATWYALHGVPQKDVKQAYPLPEEITVLESTIPCKETAHDSNREVDGSHVRSDLECVVKTADIDFSSDFRIKTDKYELIKNEDRRSSRAIGKVLSLPAKLYFGDWDISKGLDADKTRAVLSMLENKKDLNGLTVRINHNEAFHDAYRLFTDERLKERNNVVARALLGVSTCIFDEVEAEVFRSDYYNPLTQTVVVYSNVESIAAHEIGHHQDYQRFTSDWEYSLASAAMPVKLYKEWQASQNAKTIMSSQDAEQFDRYLLPAFFTYILGGIYASKQLLKIKRWALGQSVERGADKEELEQYVHPLETFRQFATLNAELYAGIGAYTFAHSSTESELAGCLAFAGGVILTGVAAKAIGRRVIPYSHEI